MMIEGSGSWRPKNMWIRWIRIRNTATDTEDPLRRFCPYAQRTVLVLNAKDVDYQIVNCALMNKPDWLFKLNPLGTYRKTLCC